MCRNEHRLIILLRDYLGKEELQQWVNIPVTIKNLIHFAARKVSSTPLNLNQLKPTKNAFHYNSIFCVFFFFEARDAAKI